MQFYHNFFNYLLKEVISEDLELVQESNSIASNEASTARENGVLHKIAYNKKNNLENTNEFLVR